MSEKTKVVCPPQMKGPYYGCDMGKVFIWTDCGDTTVLDIRGWGYLTGGAALKLSEDQAVEIQDQFEKWVIEALNHHTRQEAAERKLAEYSFLGGMVDVGLYDGQLEWEAGRNLGPAYCVDGKGPSLVECAESIADHVMEEMRANRDKA